MKRFQRSTTSSLHRSRARLRDIPTCIRVGSDEGIDHDSVATFDNLAAVPKSVLTTRLGQLGAGGRRQICDALDALANC